MFWKREEKEKRKLARERKKATYDRVRKLHQEADFLCYIDEVSLEEYEGTTYVKLIGSMAVGEGTIHEKYLLYSCEGREKAKLDIDEFYVGADSVEKLESGDQTVAIYPKQVKGDFRAGDILCKFPKRQED